MAIQTEKVSTSTNSRQLFNTLQLRSATSRIKGTQMASSTIIQTCKKLNMKEEWLADLDAKIYETTLTPGNLTKIKNKLT